MTDEDHMLPPGSAQAVEHGCTCPVLDNHHGAGMPDGKGGAQWWISEGCPLHDGEDDD